MGQVPAGEAGRGAEHADRLARLRSVLSARGVDAALLGTRRNVAWVTAGASGHIDQSTEASVAAVLVTRDDAVMITSNIEAARMAEEELAGIDLEVVAVPWWAADAIDAEARRRLGPSASLARDADLEADLVTIRSVLSPFDRARMATLGRQAASAMDAALAELRAGTTEDDLAADLLHRLPGVRVPVVLVAADERLSRHRHPLPGATPIRTRVMAVLVVERWGLHVALTRLRELEPPGADLARRLAAVAEVQATMHAATRPGATFGDVFAAAQAAYVAAGFPDEWRDHHQGGTIAYRSRERVAGPGDPTPIQAGMALAWNPSIAGAKAEDTIVLGDDGAATVITAP